MKSELLLPPYLVQLTPSFGIEADPSNTALHLPGAWLESL